MPDGAQERRKRGGGTSRGRSHRGGVGRNRNPNPEKESEEVAAEKAAAAAAPAVEEPLDTAVRVDSVALPAIDQQLVNINAQLQALQDRIAALQQSLGQQDQGVLGRLEHKMIELDAKLDRRLKALQQSVEAAAAARPAEPAHGGISGEQMKRAIDLLEVIAFALSTADDKRGDRRSLAGFLERLMKHLLSQTLQEIARGISAKHALLEAQVSSVFSLLGQLNQLVDQLRVQVTLQAFSPQLFSARAPAAPPAGTPSLGQEWSPLRPSGPGCNP